MTILTPSTKDAGSPEINAMDVAQAFAYQVTCINHYVELMKQPDAKLNDEQNAAYDQVVNAAIVIDHLVRVLRDNRVFLESVRNSLIYDKSKKAIELIESIDKILPMHG